MKRTWLVAAFAATASFAALRTLAAQAPSLVSFELRSEPKFVECLRDPNSSEEPSAKVTVVRGSLNDTLHLKVEHVKPGLAFDLFTVQRTNLLADGTVDPAFKNFGLAWYQSDVEVGHRGQAEVQIKTILLDQIFGFDADPQPGSATGAPLVAPTHTFHVGFWFDNPQDAAACGFDPTKRTPFNGDQNAGPLAMISVPDGTTGLGPLCSNPQISGNTINCNP